jgi:phenylalanyl-tRNA synthetase beta chain
MSGQKELGYLGEVHPQVGETYQADQRIQLASLDIKALLMEQHPKKYQALSKYPDVTRDLAVVVPIATASADVMNSIREVAGGLLKELRLFDLYQGSQIAEGQKSLAFALTWQAEDRTLQDDEINQFHQVIEAKLVSTYGGQVRGR